MATIKDVAKYAGVSVTTVSYFLNNKKKLKDETRERILVAIKETGYRYNSAAGSLKRSRDSISQVGIISIVDQNPFFSQLFRSKRLALSCKIATVLFLGGFCKIVVAFCPAKFIFFDSTTNGCTSQLPAS